MARITRNFINAILHNENLISPGYEGLKSLSLSNAMLLSSWTGNRVEFPINAKLYKQFLDEKIANSTIVKEKTNIVLETKGTY